MKGIWVSATWPRKAYVGDMMQGVTFKRRWPAQEDADSSWTGKWETQGKVRYFYANNWSRNRKTLMIVEGFDTNIPQGWLKLFVPWDSPRARSMMGVSNKTYDRIVARKYSNHCWHLWFEEGESDREYRLGGVRAFRSQKAAVVEASNLIREFDAGRWSPRPWVKAGRGPAR